KEYARMKVSAEARWFWRDSLPRSVHDWFHAGKIAPGGGRTRDDVYLRTSELELGIKRRGSVPGVEIKGLVSSLPPLAVGSITVHPQLWTKWSTPAFDIASLACVTTHKRRLLRKLSGDVQPLMEIALGEDELPKDPKQ